MLEITVLEPDPGLRKTAGENIRDCHVPVRFLDGAFERLPVPARSVDVLVSSLVMCHVPRPNETLGEIMRVLAPGGELRFCEHVRSSRLPAALGERLISPIWSLTAGGCHPARDILRLITRAGFAVERIERFERDGISYVLGVARRP